MTIIENFAADLAGMDYGAADPVVRSAVDNHILDTVAATLAGSATEDGRGILCLRSDKPGNAQIKALGTGPLDDVASWCAMTRLSEIDDIHLSSGTTPGSIVVPSAIVLSKHMGVTDAALFASAVMAGYEAMTRLGAAADGQSLVYKGVWTTYFAAPLGTAAVTARLLQLSPNDTAHAIAIALTMLSGRMGQPGSEKTARWLTAGHAARMGSFAAVSAAEGFRGDLGLIDRDWFEKAQGIEIDRAAFTPERGRSVVPDISIKPYCSAKQMIGAIAGFEELLASGIDAGAIEKILVSVPENYAAMIDHGVVTGNRLSSVTSAPYQLAPAAYNIDGLFDVARSEYKLSDDVTGLMDKVSVAVDADLAKHLPANWPARVDVTANGKTRSVTIIDAPGDPGAPFDAARVLQKFHQFVDPLIGEAAADAWAAPASNAASDDAALSELQDKYLAIGSA